ALLLLWFAVMKIHFGESPANELARYYTSHFSFTQVLLPLCSFVGAVGVFPWVFCAWMEKRGKWMVVGVSVAGALLLTFLARWPAVSYRLWFVVLASSGVALMIVFAMTAVR